jgi:hypothetical protein
MEKNCKSLFIIAFTASMIVACGGKKEKARHTKTASLIESVDQLHVDTIVTTPGEILCTPEIDHILRHYPELFQATKQALKMYEKLTEQNLEFVKDGGYDVRQLLDQALFGKDTDTYESEWPDFSNIDNKYLQMIADATTVEEKSEIGRTRRAWKEYMKQLESIAQALPEESRPRFIEAVKEEAK